MEIQNLTRVFKMGSVVLQDIAPEMSAEESVRLYTPNFPYLTHCTLAAPRVEGDQVIYEIIKPPVKSKG